MGDPKPELWTSGTREKSAKLSPDTRRLPVRKRHSPEQIAAALRQAEAGTPVAEIARKLGILENTFYTWKRRFGGLGTPEILVHELQTDAKEVQLALLFRYKLLPAAHQRLHWMYQSRSAARARWG